MCVRIEIGKLFSAYNWVFALFHACVFAACISLDKHEREYAPFNTVVVDNDIKLPLRLAPFGIVMSSVSVVMHLVFAVYSSGIIQNSFMQFNCNVFRYIPESIANVFGVLGLYAALGGHSFFEFAMIIMIMCSLTAFAYYQDKYILYSNGMAEKEPHIFAAPLYFALFVLIVSVQHCRPVGDCPALHAETRTYSIIAFVLFGCAFVIQRAQVYMNVSDQVLPEEGAPIVESDKDVLDAKIADVRRGVMFEFAYYFNTLIFQIMVVYTMTMAIPTWEPRSP